METTSHKISVAGALKKLENGESINDYLIDFDRIKVESLDVMKLSKGGIVVPESAIYYDDEDIAYDEDFEGDWVLINHHPETAQTTQVEIVVQKEVQQWIENNHVPLDRLVEKLSDNFYRTQKSVSENL
jgi:hypothetical protein